MNKLPFTHKQNRGKTHGTVLQKLINKQHSIWPATVVCLVP
jgi:hypothetical protein